MQIPLGPDGKPCKPCVSFKDWTKLQKKNEIKKEPSSLERIAKVTLADKFGCPVDADELGRHTWTFLHTSAAYYPPAASESQQNQMRNLINLVGTFYPCGDCAGHLRKYVKQYPPQVHSRSALELWLCQMHNEVNVRLGKDEFDCNKVGQRWRDGWNDKSCD
ncbi:FAD-dependent thiol oxidase [Wallemia mellicola]|uniref:Sulfhydryl oxidase n=1 Tax=Wallemia mellicola TaxID=1708541 RepID=A0AB74KHL1_9BASI|nr:FAD-dependent thiol oxidase [Wallemia mellicola]TIC37544.1 FAD-dependent thiol oxidase [Wallemia mellicola]TIC70644.1 FAD-dependent thiol oxidase [Wallemia mellicola]